MILSRVIEHVKAQNWTAIALDFIIVVSGVFIGMQVNGWNQQRLAAENDRQVLALFVEEVEQMLKLANDDVESTRRRLDNGGLASEIALNCEANDEERALLVNAVASVLDWRIPNVMPSGLAAISKPDILARIGNPDLTRAVGRLNESIAFMSYANEFATPQYEQAMEMLLPFVVLARPLLTEDGKAATSFEPTLRATDLSPMETLCASQQFKTGLMVLTTYNQDVYYYFVHWRDSLDGALALARDELGG